MTRPTLQPRYSSADAIARLTQLLNLPDWGQDWEIEVAAAARVGEFLDVYESHTLEEDERFALMELIIASYDDLLREGRTDEAERHGGRLRRHLLEHFDLHGYTVQYWALPDEDDAENVFPVTPLVRQVMTAVFGPRDRWPRRPILIKRFIDWANPVVPGGWLDVLQLSDNRDGSGYTLWWSRYRDRPAGERQFATVAEAMAYAAREFGVPPERWQDV